VSVPFVWLIEVIMSRIVLLFAVVHATAASAQISALYPGDVGIGSDPRVLFTEQFENDLPTITSNYDDVLNPAGMSVDSDVPAGSAGAQSLRLTNIGGQNSGGHLYKRFTPGWDSTIYLRYYVKYPSSSQGYIHHESIWLGGYNPSIPWPYPRAGECGLGDARISIAYEPVANGMNTYMYWGGMHNDPNGDCWGNVIIEGDSVARPVPFDEWLCVEMMVKLNHPDTAHNGELRIWHNGEEVGYWGQGFPTGHWLWDKFHITAGDPAFEGFQWRTDEALNLNYIWIEYYDDNSPNGVSHHILYDHLVIATERIGPLEPALGLRPGSANKHLQFQGPDADGRISLQVPPEWEGADVRFIDASGRVLLSRVMNGSTERWDVSAFVPGIYACEVRHDGGRLRTSFVKAY
jgi:hypothetical protein